MPAYAGVRRHCRHACGRALSLRTPAPGCGWQCCFHRTVATGQDSCWATAVKVSRGLAVGISTEDWAEARVLHATHSCPSTMHCRHSLQPPVPPCRLPC